MSLDNDTPGSDSPSSRSDREPRPRIYSSKELLQGCTEAWIEHEGQMYRLRVTSKGNLILTK
ncbi:MAG: hemin uptake protein HemP [Planctomycetota bacterium]